MNIKKIILFFGVVAIICVAHVATVKALTCLQGSGGGTGICTATSTDVGKTPVVSSLFNGTPVYTLQNASGTGGGGGSATTTINGALGPVFQFVASSTGNALLLASTTSSGSSTIQFLLDLSAYLKSALQSLNGATSSAQTIVAGAGESVTTVAGAANSTTTVTNTGVTSFTGQGCVTAANSTGTVALTVTCISGNQNITFTISGDATGTASGATSITDSITVTGLNGKVLPANTTGTLQFSGNAWKINLATSSLGVYDANGNVSSFGGSNCVAGSVVTGLSATGTVACAATSTILTGYSTSTGANPTAKVGSAAVNGTANTFLRSDAAPPLDTAASFIFTGAHTHNATTTFSSSTIFTNNTSTLLSTNASGSVQNFGGSTCGAQFAQQISASGTLICATPTSGSATTSINGTQSASFSIVGDNIGVTSTVSGATTTLSLINQGVGDGSYYLTNTASDLSNNNIASDTPQSSLASTTVAALSNGTTSIQKWTTVANVPGVPFIPIGVIDVHIAAAQTAGTKPTQIYATVQEVSATGTILGTIITTPSSTTLTGSLLEYDLDNALTVPYNMQSTASRIQVNVIANVSGALLAPTVQVYYGGTSADSRLEIPASTVDVTTFVPYSGAIKNVNIGSNSLTTGALTASGVSSLATTTVTKNLTVQGDLLDNSGNKYSTSTIASSTIITIITATTSVGTTAGVTSTILSATLPLATTSTVYFVDANYTAGNNGNSATTTVFLNNTAIMTCHVVTATSFDLNGRIVMLNSTSSEFMILPTTLNGTSCGLASIQSFNLSTTTVLSIQEIRNSNGSALGNNLSIVSVSGTGSSPGGSSFTPSGTANNYTFYSSATTFAATSSIFNNSGRTSVGTSTDNGNTFQVGGSANITGLGTTTKSMVTIADASGTLALTPLSWEFLGSCIIQVASSTCGSGVSIPARDELMIVVRIIGYGGSDIASLRFNGDTGSNYYSRFEIIAIGGTTTTNVPTNTTNFGRMFGNAQTTGRSAEIICSNNLGTEKICSVNGANGTGAVGTSPVLSLGGMIGWVNTAAQITSVQLITQGGSTLNASSAIMIYGRNF